MKVPEDTELVELAARCDQDSLLKRAGWRLYGEGERNVAAAMESIEEDVTDNDMCTDLI